MRSYCSTNGVTRPSTNAGCWASSRNRRTFIDGELFKWFDGEKWREPFSFSRLFTFFAREGVGNPARDLGNFMAYLRWKAIRKPKDADFIERVGQVFLDGYQAAGRAIDQRWLMLYTADSMLKIAGRRYRSLTAKEWHLVPRLLDGALAALDTVSVGEQTA